MQMKQSIRAATAAIRASVHIPGSKSITNRALLLAALAEGVSDITDILISEDTLALVKALQALGIDIAIDEGALRCKVTGCKGKFPVKEASVWCADAGTVTRFLLAACAASSGVFHFDASARMRERPLAPLLKILCAQGARTLPDDAVKMPFTLNGVEHLRGGEIEVAGGETSQFISALLMAAPFAKHAVMLKIHDAMASPYVEMTCDMMADFGVLVRRMHQARFSVPLPQAYQARDYVVEPDISTASYFFAAAAVTAGEMTIQPVNRALSKQGDIEFLNVLEKMGCKVTESAAGLKVEAPRVLQGVSVNMRNFSDTFMTLAALAPFADSATTITNIGHTRLQESNRISAMREGLEKIGIKVEEGPDWLKIFPGVPRAAVINSHHDHRIAMAFSVIGLRVSGIEIEGAECVAKTCPDFFKMWENLCHASEGWHPGQS
jgi:3-phosphoshikimate 1-carboxyvinyltransferase